MRPNGFSLVEMLFIMMIIGVLVGLGSMSFKKRGDKDKIEGQVKMMYTDLMSARSQALYNKHGSRAVTITGNGTLFSVYSSDQGIGTVNPLRTLTLKASVTPVTMRIDFDEQGMATFNVGAITTPAAIAVTPICVSTSAAGVLYDSILLQQSQIQLGLNSGGCLSANIVRK